MMNDDGEYCPRATLLNKGRCVRMIRHLSLTLRLVSIRNWSVSRLTLAPLRDCSIVVKDTIFLLRKSAAYNYEKVPSVKGEIAGKREIRLHIY